MAKPSVTNIRPPSKTDVWLPPKTSWDLNVVDDVTAAGAFYGDHVTKQAEFTSLTDSINTVETSERDDVSKDDMQGSTEGDFNYDYVFFGVNGGENETVVAKDNAKGILVTGNGMDTIVGEYWSNADKVKVYEKPTETTGWTYHTADSLLVYAGNGKDTVYGSAHSDILFGENGPDQLHGNGDDGNAKAAEGSVAFKAGIKEYSGNLADLPLDTNTDGNPLNKVQSTQSFLYEGGKLYEVFELNLKDLTPLNDDGLSTDVTIVVYDNGGVGNFTFDDVKSLQTTSFDDGNWTKFAVEIQQAWGANAKVFVFLGHLDSNNAGDLAKLNNPDDSAQTNAAPLRSFDSVITVTPASVTFDAGDELIGGNGPDQFFWDASDTINVDLIWDYNQADGGAPDAAEGDKLVLQGVTQAELDAATILSGVDLDHEGSTGLVIYFGEDHAIGLVGISSLSEVDIVLV